MNWNKTAFVNIIGYWFKPAPFTGKWNQFHFKFISDTLLFLNHFQATKTNWQTLGVSPTSDREVIQ